MVCIVNKYIYIYIYIYRKSINVCTVLTQRTAFLRTFFPSPITKWNIFDINLYVKETHLAFQTIILEFCLYNSHNPKCIKLLTRFRLGLSHLREHKFKSFSSSINTSWFLI